MNQTSIPIRWDDLVEPEPLSPGQAELARILGPLDGTRIPGGCETCDELEDGVEFVRLRDVFARVCSVADALGDGDFDYAAGLLGDLEADLARLLGADRRPFACGVCGLTFRWPGELDHHRRGACGLDEEARAA